MLKFSKKLLYAIEAVVDIAYNSGVDPVQIGDVTHRQGVPQRYLEQVMQRLVKANILVGIRGPRGGYRLAREHSRISLGDIARVVMDMADASDTEYGLPVDGTIGQQVIRPLWIEFQDHLLTVMDHTSIEELVTRTFRAGIARGAICSTRPPHLV